MVHNIAEDIDPDGSYSDLTAFKKLDNRKCILFAGGIIFNDRVPFLDTVAKQIPNLRFILMCENLRNRKNVHNKFKEYYKSNPDSKLEYFPVPNRLMRDNHEKNCSKVITSDLSNIISEKQYLRESAENLRHRYKDMGSGYPEYMAYWMYRYLSDVLDKIEPIAVIIWNKYHALNNILNEMCQERGIKTMYMEYGVLPGTLCLEQNGQMGESYPSKHHAEFSKLPINDESLKRAQKTWDYLYSSHLNRKSQPKNDNLKRITDLLEPGNKTILYLGVNDYESGICPYTEKSKNDHSPIFGCSDAGAKFLSQLSVKNGWNIIYKPHPIIAGDIDIQRTDDGVIMASDVDINELIDICDVVVTILSQAGYISTIRHKATLMLGYTQLYGKGITYEATSLNEIESKLVSALENGFTESMENNFRKHIAQTTDYYLLDDLSNKRMSIGMSYKQCVKFIECTLEGKNQMQAMIAANGVGRYVGKNPTSKQSIKEIRQFAKGLTKPVVLVVGHMCYDNETDYIYQIAKRMRDYKLVNLNLHYRAQYDRIYNPSYVNYKNTSAQDLRLIKFFLAPELFTKDHYPKHYDMEISDQMRELMDSDDYIHNAALNLKLRHRDMGSGYAENFACEAYNYLNDVLDTLKPSVVIMWNKFHAFNSILDHVCKQKEVRTLYMEFGPLPGTYTLEPIGQMGESAIARFHSEFMKLEVDSTNLSNAESTLTYLKRTGLSRRKQPKTDLNDLIKKIDNGRPTILYAGQNDYESGLIPYTSDSCKYHSPNFKSSGDALNFLANIAKKNDWNLIYKPHPVITKYSEDSSYPENVIVMDADINQLIDICDVTTTILSQVSYVSLIRDKPVVMLGFTQLRGNGSTYEAFELEKIEDVFKKAIADGYTSEQRSLFVKHVAQIMRYYLLDNIDEDKDLTYINNVSMAVTQILMAIKKYGNLFLPPEKMLVETISERSEKNLIQSQDITDAIHRDSIKVVSFDIFDTLLERPIIEPADIYRLVGRRLELPYDYPKYRDIAQRMAGQNKPPDNDSVTLDEIYHYFAELTGESGECIEKIKQEEMRVESEYLYPRPLGKKLYQAALESGKDIIITSDMYLPEEFIASVLKDNGFEKYKRLFVSCTSMRSKKTGRLYDYVLSSLDRNITKPHNILHIGDNSLADFDRAMEHGLVAIHVPKTSDLLKKVGPLSTLYKYVDKNMDNSFILGLIANRIFADPYFSYDRSSAFNGKPEYLATLVYAPILMMFVKWMMDDISHDDKDKVYFLTRDGYLPHKVYNLFCRFYNKMPPAEDMHLNRSLMYAFCANNPNGLIDADLKYPPSSKMKIEDYTRNRVYANSDEQFKEIMSVFKTNGYSPDDEVRKLLYDFDTRKKLNPYFFHNLKPCADALTEYYHDMLYGHKASIFDVGYRGRAARFLDDELGYKITEYHIISRPEVPSLVAKRYDVRSWINVSNLTVDNAEIAFILLDTILSIQEPGIRCIEPSDEGIKWVREREDKFTDTIQSIQNEMMDVIAEMAEKYAKDWHRFYFDPYPFIDLMIESLTKPTQKDILIFKDQNTPNEPAFVDMSKKNNIKNWVTSNSVPKHQKIAKPSTGDVQSPPLPIQPVSSALIALLEKLHLTGVCKRLYEIFGNSLFKKR